MALVSTLIAASSPLAHVSRRLVLPSLRTLYGHAGPARASPRENECNARRVVSGAWSVLVESHATYQVLYEQDPGRPTPLAFARHRLLASCENVCDEPEQGLHARISRSSTVLPRSHPERARQPPPPMAMPCSSRLAKSRKCIRGRGRGGEGTGKNRSILFPDVLPAQQRPWRPQTRRSASAGSPLCQSNDLRNRIERIFARHPRGERQKGWAHSCVTPRGNRQKGRARSRERLEGAASLALEHE